LVTNADFIPGETGEFCGIKQTTSNNSTAMKNIILGICFLLLIPFISDAQPDTTKKGTFWKPVPRNYEVKQAIEVESLFPMFFYGGYHVGVCYRYKHFRFRVSVINGGSYDTESAGIPNSSDEYSRYYKTSPGFFAGYNVWKNLEAYIFLEFHTFQIEQKSTGETQDIQSTDFGGGVSYQFFLGRVFYIQPGLHIYLRGDHGVTFETGQYNIPNVDVSPVIRIGARLWKRF
jgi:hypothetical protein